MHIAIQGDPASFHELAAIEYYPSTHTYLYCQTFAEVFHALESGEVDRGFVAISNSSHGRIDEVHQLLLTYRPIVEATYKYAVRQHLIGLPSTQHADITTVVSHPVALSQCSHYIGQYQHQQVVPYYDTAAAIRYVQETADRSIVAVGSREAAERYGLAVLCEDIHNDPDNHTVFASIRAA